MGLDECMTKKTHSRIVKMKTTDANGNTVITEKTVSAPYSKSIHPHRVDVGVITHGPTLAPAWRDCHPNSEMHDNHTCFLSQITQSGPRGCGDDSNAR